MRASAPAGRFWKKDRAEILHRRPDSSSCIQARRSLSSSSVPTTITSSGTATSSTVGLTTTIRSPVRDPTRMNTPSAGP